MISESTSTTSSNRLRYLIVGVGAHVARLHRDAITQAGGTVVGCADTNETAARDAAEHLGCRWAADHRELLDLRPDVAVVLTPHPFHADVAIDCLHAGCHVLVEKPMALHVAQADEVLRAAAANDRLVAVAYQHRFREVVQVAKGLMNDGDVGELQSFRMTVAATRTRAYYDTSPWRGSWRGEGGGVVMNQGPHWLDLLGLLVGWPTRVYAAVRTQHHPIEAEDTVDALLTLENGSIGYVHMTTAEAGQPERLEVVGDRAVLTLTRDELSIRRFSQAVTTHLDQSDPFAGLDYSDEVLITAGRRGSHADIHRNLVDAIQHGQPLAAPAAEGLRSLEVGNAIIVSGASGVPVALPLARNAYPNVIDSLVATSRRSR